MRTRPLLLSLSSLIVALVVAACSSGGGSSSANAVLAGTWQWTSGPLVTGASFGNLGYLQLATVGTGTLFATTPNEAVPICEPVSAAVLGPGQVALDIPDFSGGGGAISFYRFSIAGDALTLTDVDGNVTTFRRAASVPAAQTCAPLAPVQTYSISVLRQIQFGYPVGIAATTTAVWFSPASGGALALDPVTGTTGAYVAIAGQVSDVTAMQGNDFWAFCNCGGEPFALYDAAGNQIGPQYAPPNNLGLAGLAFDGTRLWAVGYDYSARTSAIFKLDLSTTPAGILAETPLDFYPQGMAFRGSQLWMVGNLGPSELLELDTAGRVQAAYRFPHDGAWREGVGGAGGSLYVGRQGASQAQGFIDRFAL